MKRSKLGTILVMFFIIVLLLCACKPTIKTGDGEISIGKDGITVTDDEGNTGTISSDDDGTVTITTDDGTLVAGSTKLPEGYPEKEFPLYEMVEITATLYSNEEEGLSCTISFNSKAEYTEVVNYYKELFKDVPGGFYFSDDEITTISGVNYKNYDFSIIINNYIVEGEKDATCSIAISFNPHEE